MRKELRKQQVLKRKNFFPTLIVTFLFWLTLSGLVYFVDPGVFGAVPIFFIFLFLSLLFTFSLLFANSRRGTIAAFSLFFFSVLAFLGVGNMLNLILIVAIAITVELYFSLK